MNSSVLPLRLLRHSGVNLFPADGLARSLAAEVAGNPYWFRAALRPASPLRRRMPRCLAAGLLGAALVFSFVLTASPGRSALLLFELYLPLRFILLYRAARLTVIDARCEVDAGNLQHLALAPMGGRAMAGGWALTGWSLALPETLAVFIALSPLTLLAGPWFVGLALVELIHLLLLQALAALVAAGLVAGYHHRYEAATAGWLSAAFSFPLAFLLQALVFGLLMLLLPLALMLMLGASAPAGWPELDAGFCLNCAAVIIGAVYALWLPVAALKEIDRQLDVASTASVDGIWRYLRGASS